MDFDTSQILKGIAILFVLLGHTNYYIWGGAGGVALFLILSGYGINLSCEKNGLKHYWKKRFNKVWLPYIIIGIFDVLALRINTLPRVLTTITGLDFNLIADRTMWYISYIMLWYAVYYVLAFAFQKIRSAVIKSCGLVAGLCAASLLIPYLSSKGVWNYNAGAPIYACFFPLGVALSCLGRIKVRENFKDIFWLIILFASSVYLFREYGNPYTTQMALAMAIQPMSFLQFFKLHGRVKRALLWFGKYSYPIYLFEGLFLYTRNSLFSVMVLQPFIDAMFFAVTILSAYIYWSSYQKLTSVLHSPR